MEREFSCNTKNRTYWLLITIKERSVLTKEKQEHHLLEITLN